MALARQCLNQLILRTHDLGRPLQVVRFVDDQHIPLRIDRMLRPAFVTQQRANAANHQLIFHKGIRLRVRIHDRLAALRIK